MANITNFEYSSRLDAEVTDNWNEATIVDYENTCRWCDIDAQVQKIVDKINLSGKGESANIYNFIYKNKKLLRLIESEEEVEQVYNLIAQQLGFMK